MMWIPWYSAREPSFESESRTPLDVYCTNVFTSSGVALTGNRNNPATDASGKQCAQHVMVFTSDRIASLPSIGLTKGGMVLIALLSGGDYNNGIKNIGPKIAHGLARCGFGDRLVSAYRMGEAHFRAFLPQWRNELNTELRTNANGMLLHRCPSAIIPANWPDMLTLTAYVNPVCSGLNGDATSLRDRGDMSLPRLAKFCEDHFDEWGHRSRILERFHNFMYEGAVFHVLRRAALEADEKERTKRLREGRPGHIREPLCPAASDAVGTPASLVQRYLDPEKKDSREERLADVFVNRGTPRASTSTPHIPDTHPLIESIVGKRTHLSTDSIFELRVVIRCKQLDDHTNKGIAGKHPEPAPSAPQNLPDEDGVYGTGGAKKSKKPIDRSTKRIWVAASIMRQVHPELVERFEAEGAPKVIRRKRQAAVVDEDDGEDEDDSDSAPEFEGPSSPLRSQPASARASRKPIDSQVTSVASPAATGGPRPPWASRRPRVLHNVGDINFERPSNRNAFLFTFSDPCDPEMLISDDENPSVPEFVVGSSSASVPAYRPASPSKAGTVDYDEPFPTQFTARQEAIIDRALGLISGGGSNRTNTRKATQPRNQDPASSTASRTPRATASSALGPVPPLPTPSQPRRASTQSYPASSQPLYDKPTPSQFSAAQEVIIDRALSLSSASSSAARKARPKRDAAPARKRGGDGLASAALPDASDVPVFDEPVPSQFTAAQEAMIDRALGLAGGTSSKQTRAASAQKRTTAPAMQAAEGSQQAKRRRTTAVSASSTASTPPILPLTLLPIAPVQPTPPRRRLAPFPELPPLDNPNDRSYHGVSPRRPPQARTIPADTSIIDISDDEPVVAASTKRAPAARRTAGWGSQIPSSSQESRLADFPEFHIDLDFDLT